MSQVLHELPEDAEERRMFNSYITTFGSPLHAVSAALTIWSKTLPQEGSMAKQCAVMANEVGRASVALQDIAGGRLGVTDAMLESKEAMMTALASYCQRRAREALSA